MKEFVFNSIIELIQKFDSEQKCIDFLEQQRWNGIVVSPYDSTSKVCIRHNLIDFVQK